MSNQLYRVRLGEWGQVQVSWRGLPSNGYLAGFSTSAESIGLVVRQRDIGRAIGVELDVATARAYPGGDRGFLLSLEENCIGVPEGGDGQFLMEIAVGAVDCLRIGDDVGASTLGTFSGSFHGMVSGCLWRSRAGLRRQYEAQRNHVRGGEAMPLVEPLGSAVGAVGKEGHSTATICAGAFDSGL